VAERETGRSRSFDCPEPPAATPRMHTDAVTGPGPGAPLPAGPATFVGVQVIPWSGVPAFNVIPYRSFT